MHAVAAAAAAAAAACSRCCWADRTYAKKRLKTTASRGRQHQKRQGTSEMQGLDTWLELGAIILLLLYAGQTARATWVN